MTPDEHSLPLASPLFRPTGALQNAQ